MNSTEGLMGMVLQDAIERGGSPEVHHFDETQNHSSIPEMRASGNYLLPIRYDLELIRGRDGSLDWAE